MELIIVGLSMILLSEVMALVATISGH